MDEQYGGETFGARVRARRIALGLSQSALASAASVTPAAICQLESGLIRGKKATRELLEKFLRTRERSQASVARVKQWTTSRAAP